MQLFLERIWYQNSKLKWGLLPLAYLFSLVSRIRKFYFQRFAQQKFKIPIVVIGNLSVGGTGKTPLVIAIAQALLARHWKVAIIMRGYKSKLNQYPYEVSPIDDARRVGDEPLLVAHKTGCPVIIGSKRVQSVEYILNNKKVDIIISDDGLQHYAMGRALEIAVIDGSRGLGNGLFLPAGPLRESAKRLKAVDFIVINEGKWPHAYQMQLKAIKIKNMKTGQEVSAAHFKQSVAAVAGIGNPQRFFSTLALLGIPYRSYIFPDHYDYSPHDLNYSEPFLLMTEKDAIKCKSFAQDNWFTVMVAAHLDKAFWTDLWAHPALKGEVNETTSL